MDLNNFTSLPPSVLDDLYEEPAAIESLSFDDFLNLPLNDLYKSKNANTSFDIYKSPPKITNETPAPSAPIVDEPANESLNKNSKIEK
jgi:hypothetical protein